MDRVVKASKEVSRASSCDHKVRFNTRVQAKKAALRRDGRIVYKCVHCRHWHVGTMQPREKKFEKRKKLVKLFLEVVND